MKLIFISTLMIFSGLTQAQSFQTKLDIFEQDFNRGPRIADEISLSKLYSVKFKKTKVQKICPTGRPGEVVCQAQGSVITVKATLNGCLDSLVNFKIENIYMYDNKLHIEIKAMAFADPRSARVRCIKMPEVIKTVETLEEDFDGVTIVNLNNL